MIPSEVDRKEKIKSDSISGALSVISNFNNSGRESRTGLLCNVSFSELRLAVIYKKLCKNLASDSVSRTDAHAPCVLYVTLELSIDYKAFIKSFRP